jgi:hypothetical protein
VDTNNKVCDPRANQSIKGTVNPYEVDSSYVLTIGWPERKEASFLNNIIGESPYSKDMIVNGRISWKDFMLCELFSDILQELSIEVMNEKPKEHPAIEMGAFFTELNTSDFVLPMSVDKGRQSMSPFTLQRFPSFSFQRFPSLSEISEPGWISTSAPNGPSAISFSPSGFSPRID